MVKYTRRASVGGSRRRYGGKKTARKSHRKGRRKTRKRRGGDLGTDLLPFIFMGMKHGYQKARGHKVHRKKKNSRKGHH